VPFHRNTRALLRLAAVAATRPLPEERRRAIERWIRGWEEWHALCGADIAFVSYGKSGRTWLRLMLSRFYQQRYGLPEGTFLEYDNLHRRSHAIPRVFFTHGNYLKDFSGHADAVFEDFRHKPVLLLLRDPRDVAVSQYFHWKGRMRPHKKWINRYPPHGATLSVSEFVLDHEAGLTRAIQFLVRWARALPLLDRAVVIRYEQMRENPHHSLRGALEFLGAEPTAAEIDDAVEYAAFDNMRKLEEKGGVAASGQRLTPGHGGDTSSYKVRRGKVGGYRDYFDASELERLDRRVAAELGHAWGYAAPTSGAPSPGKGSP